ncbi:MAG: DUF7219 family protein [Thainema sp.]
MSESDDPKQNFLYPIRRYRGEFTPQNIAFDANLQEFAQRVEFICALENAGKLDPNVAYDEIKGMWKSLKRSKKNLLDDSAPPQDADNS